jgi:hypothetical protein
MIDKININQIQDPRQAGDGPSAGQANRPKQAANSQADATLQIDYGKLIEQALNTPQADTDAVQRAKELLQSGQLDNPANIKEAAENIIKFGI